MKRLLALFLVLVVGLLPLSAGATFGQDVNININVNLPEMDYGDILDQGGWEDLFKPEDSEDPWEDFENPWGDFEDLDEDQWYWAAVEYCLENGLMEGMENGLFFPNAKTTRAQLVTMLWRLENSPEAEDCDLDFDDVNPWNWHYDAVCWAADAGIVKGYSDTAFGPNDPITREQLVTILYRYTLEKDYDSFIRPFPSILQYEDADQISTWALQAMQWAVGAEIISGTGEDTLSPGDDATRAQIASIFYRYCNHIVE